VGRLGYGRAKVKNVNDLILFCTYSKRILREPHWFFQVGYPELTALGGRVDELGHAFDVFSCFHILRFVYHLALEHGFSGYFLFGIVEDSRAAIHARAPTSSKM